MIDLEQQPYRHSVELLSALRESDGPRDRVTFEEVRTEVRGTHDRSGPERARLAHVLLLEGTPEDVEIARFLLRQEVTARRRDSFQGAGDPLAILSMLLVQWGQPDSDDTWLFWTAKTANFDTFAGGYDIEFVFAQLEPNDVLQVIREHGSSEDLEMLAKYDTAEILRSLPEWRVSLATRYPRTVEDMDSRDCEAWADLFGDVAGVERFGLQNAETPDARARLYRRLERYDAAVREWRSAAAAAESSWDRVSRLGNALTDAARVPMPMSAEVDAIDALRSEIPSWNEVGLGRMTTQACYELAAALDGEEGPRLWRIAEGWRRGLTSFSLVGLRAALAAAHEWGSDAEVATLQSEIDAEHQRIYGGRA